MASSCGVRVPFLFAGFSLVLTRRVYVASPCFAFAFPSDLFIFRAVGRTASRSRPVLVFVAAVHLVSSRRPPFRHCLSNCGSRTNFGRRFFCSWSRSSRDVGRGRGMLRSNDWCCCRTAPYCRCGCCSRPGHCRRLSRAWPDRGVCRELGACLPRLLFHRASTHLCYSWCGLFSSCSHGLCSGGLSGGGCFALGGRSGGQICLSGPRGAEAGVRSASCS